MSEHQTYLRHYYRSLLQKVSENPGELDTVAEKLVENHLKLEERADHDGLIEFFLNNLGFKRRLDEVIKSLKREYTPCVLLALDVDRLKPFNDTLGHPAGDKLLLTYAQTMEKHTRPSDLKGRTGGDEFNIFLIDIDLKSAENVANRIRINIVDQVRQVFPDWQTAQTISIGMTAYTSEDDSSSLISRADQALYKAKVDRNSIVII